MRGADGGATATEYAILIAFIAVVITFAVGLFGQDLSAFYTALASKLF